VEEHNAGDSPYKLEINQFSHLSDEELAQKTGAEFSNASLPRQARFDIGPTPAPDFWDWRQKSAVQSVQDQGLCSASWAFAAVGAIEGQMRLRMRSYEKLSEQEVIDCARNKYGQIRGCSSGSDSDVYAHSKIYGLTSSSRNPYVATSYARICDLRRTPLPYSTIFSWAYIENNEHEIMDALYNNGPMYIVMHVSQDFYSYKSGVYTDVRRQCLHRSPNHAVLLVGYGTDNGVDYWLLKNSWGKLRCEKL
jgi:cathepsin S